MVRSSQAGVQAKFSEGYPIVPGESNRLQRPRRHASAFAIGALHASWGLIPRRCRNDPTLAGPPPAVDAAVQHAIAGQRCGPDHRGRAQRFSAYRALRGDHRAVRRVRAALSAGGAVLRLRHHARGPADEGAGGLHVRRAGCGRRASAQAAGGADPGRHPRRRDRRQGRRLPGAAPAARRPGRARRAGQAGVAVRAGVQRRWPRALRRLEPAQPARPGADGLAHHRAEPQPQPRLRQGRRAGDAGDAAPGRTVGSTAVRGPAHHRRRAVRARRVGAGGTAARRCAATACACATACSPI